MIDPTGPTLLPSVPTPGSPAATGVGDGGVCTLGAFLDLAALQPAGSATPAARQPLAANGKPLPDGDTAVDDDRDDPSDDKAHTPSAALAWLPFAIPVDPGQAVSGTPRAAATAAAPDGSPNTGSAVPAAKAPAATSIDGTLTGASGDAVVSPSSPSSPSGDTAIPASPAAGFARSIADGGTAAATDGVSAMPVSTSPRASASRWAATALWTDGPAVPDAPPVATMVAPVAVPVDAPGTADSATARPKTIVGLPTTLPRPTAAAPTGSGSTDDDAPHARATDVTGATVPPLATTSTLALAITTARLRTLVDRTPPAHGAASSPTIAWLGGVTRADRTIRTPQNIAATPMPDALAPLVPATTSAGAPVDLRHDTGLQRLIDHIEVLRDDADAHDTRIRLVPDALGTIDVAVRKDGDAVHVHFTAESDAARSAITDAQPRLAVLAEERGVRLAGTSVDTQATMTSGGNGGRQQPPQPAFVRPAPIAAHGTTDTPDSDQRLA